MTNFHLNPPHCCFGTTRFTPGQQTWLELVEIRLDKVVFRPSSTSPSPEVPFGIFMASHFWVPFSIQRRTESCPATKRHPPPHGHGLKTRWKRGSSAWILIFDPRIRDAGYWSSAHSQWPWRAPQQQGSNPKKRSLFRGSSSKHWEVPKRGLE